MATGDGSRLSGATLAPPMRTSGQKGTRFSDQGCEVSQQLDDFRGRRELIGGRETSGPRSHKFVEPGMHLADSVFPACRALH